MRSVTLPRALLHPRTVVFALGAACAMCLVAPAQEPPPSQAPPGQAVVWRDEHGIPHIEASNEEDGWRALGYETGRDRLLQAQLDIKRFQGRSAEFLGGNPEALDGTVLDDLAVKLYRSYLADASSLGGDENKLKILLRRTSGPVARRDQVFKNLKAYAEGLDAYRAHLNMGIRNAQEDEFRAWLEANQYKWVYEDPITVFHVASAGPYTVNSRHLGVARNKDSSPGAKLTPTSSPLTLTEENSHSPKLELPAGPPGGSNSFCWSNNGYLQYMAEGYRAGLVADPSIDASDAYRNSGTSANDIAKAPNSVFYVHLRYDDPAVSDPAIDEPYDVFGNVEPGSGFFWMFHNGKVAIGGSTSAGNSADAFLIQVRNSAVPGQISTSSGEIASTPDQYYDYYTQDWRPLEPVSVVLKVKGNSDQSYSFLRAGSFGIVYFTTPFYAEQYSGSPDWRVTAEEGSNKFSLTSDPSANPPITLPVLVAYRLAADVRINPGPLQLSRERHLYRTAVGQYESLHATSVSDLQDLLEAHEINLGPTYLALDRDGRIFSSVAATIPQRGDDAGICAYGADGIDLADKHLVYDQLDSTPVPARYDADRVFDWIYDIKPQGQVRDYRHLKPTGDATEGNTDYLPYLLFDPSTTSTLDTSHPPQVLALGNTFENPGYATSSNNQVAESYKKDWQILDCIAPNCAQTCRRYTSPDNQLVQYLITTGTQYSARGPVPAGLTLWKNDDITDFLYRTADLDDREDLVPMTVDAAKTFALDNRNYVRYDYPGYLDADGNNPVQGVIGAVPPPSPGQYPNYPVVIRNLTELRDAAPTSPSLGFSVCDEAFRETQFFADLWDALRTTWYPMQWQLPDGSFTSLAQAWVAGTQPLFWYPELDELDPPANPSFVQQIPMPQQAQLIDFLWSESKLGNKRLGQLYAEGNLMADDERARYDNLVATLQAWDGTEPLRYRNDEASRAAALLLEYDLGFNAARFGNCTGAQPINIDFIQGRMWTPLERAQYLSSQERFDCQPIALTAHDLDLTTGLLPSDIDPESELDSGGFLYRTYMSYKGLGRLMFSSDTNESVMFDHDCGQSTCSPAQHPILGIPKPPYSALYVDPDAVVRVVRPLAGAGKLEPQHVNEIVRFFLQSLGKFSLTPERNSDGSLKFDGVSVTDKVERFAQWIEKRDDPSADPLKNGLLYGHLPYPAHYPLTRNLVRVLLMRRLNTTGDFIDSQGNPTFGEIVRARVFDPKGIQRWPVGADDAPSDGGGGIRAAALHLDGTGLTDGFQGRLLMGGSSGRTMLTLFPQDPGAQVASFFRIYPGQRASAFSSPHFADFMPIYVNNGMAPTHYTDYRSSLSTDPAFPTIPYFSPPASP